MTVLVGVQLCSYTLSPVTVLVVQLCSYILSTVTVLVGVQLCSYTLSTVTVLVCVQLCSYILFGISAYYRYRDLTTGDTLSGEHPLIPLLVSQFQPLLLRARLVLVS